MEKIKVKDYGGLKKHEGARVNYQIVEGNYP